MHLPFFQKQRGLKLAVIAFVCCSVPNYCSAQSNPFNMSNELGAHMNFESARDFARHAQAKWDRYNQDLAASGGKELMFRFELAGGIIVTDANIKFSLRSFHNEELVKDTTLSFTGKPLENGIHIAWGSGYPLTKLSENAALLLSYGMSYDGLKWGIPKMMIDSEETEFEFSSNTIGVPLFLDYKYGAEAMLDISKHICFTVGAGALPAYTLTVGDNEQNPPPFSVRPAARLEAGLATKFISFKLQAMAVMGRMKFLDETGSVRDEEYFDPKLENFDVRIEGHTQYIFSLVLMATTAAWQYKPWFR